MDYREIVAVTGMGGLYQLLTSKNDGAIVRALADGKTVFVSARKHQLTPLESIEIYTTGENVRLHNVLQKMQEHESTTPLPDTKDQKAIGAYFGTVFPDYDESRVYASDLKKMVRWYGLLKEANMLDFTRLNEEEVESPMEEEAPMPLEGQVQVKEHADKSVSDKQAASQSVEGGHAEAATDAPPAKKTRTKKAAAETTAGEEEPTEATPAKKPRAKKEGATDATGEEAAPKKTTRKKKGED